MANPIRRILVAVKDLVAGDFPAAKKAAQLARGLNAELCLFHAISEPLYAETLLIGHQSLSQIEDAATAARRAQLERLGASLRAEGVRVSTTIAWDYPAPDAVIRAALRLEADLVVAECHRATHPIPWFLHFADWELVRNCPLPLLLVKGRKPYHRGAVLAAVDPTYAHAKPADLDAEILTYGSDLALALGSALHAVHAYNFTDAAIDLAAPGAVTITQEAVEAQAREPVDLLLDQIKMPCANRHVIDGRAIDVIEGMTRDLGAQILVMGAVSRSGMRSLLIGRTAERILDRVTCDLLIVKPSHFNPTISVTPQGSRVIISPALSAAVAAMSRPMTHAF